MIRTLVFLVASVLAQGFVVRAAEPPAIEVESLLKTTTTWDGAALPAYPEGQPEITILKITVAPGESLPWHRHPVINSGVLLSGELEVTLENGQELRLKPWDAISEVVNTWHYGRNPGDEPAVILVVYSGAVGLPVTILREEKPEAEKSATDPDSGTGAAAQAGAATMDDSADKSESPADPYGG